MDPAHPFPACHRRDVLPHLGDIRRVGQSGPKIVWYVGLWPVFGWFDLERNGLALAHREGLPQLRVDLEPMAPSAIRFENGLKSVSFHYSPHRDLTAGWQLGACILGQPQYRRRT